MARPRRWASWRRASSGARTPSPSSSASPSPPAEAYTRDLLDLVFVGRDPEPRRATRCSPAIASIAPSPPSPRPCRAPWRALAPEAGLSPAQLAPSARALVRAAAAASLTTDEAPLLALSRAAVSTLVEQLFTLSSAPAAPTTAGSRLAELKALAGALE